MVFRSPHPDLSIPNQSLTSFVLHGAAQRPSKPALVDGPSGRTLTYSQFADAVARVGSALARRGVRKGDVVGLYSSNLPEYAVVLYAVASLGAVSTTANPSSTPEELAIQLADAGARYLFAGQSVATEAATAARLSRVEKVFVFGAADGLTPFDSLLVGVGTLPDVEISPQDDVVALPYSSGTTGLNKGVMLTHHNLVANLRQLEQLNIVTEHDVLIGVLPFYHIYGMVCVLHQSLHRGSTLVTLPHFELEQFLNTIQDCAVTIAHLVPSIMHQLAGNTCIEEYNLSSLRSVISGGAPLSAELSLACAERLRCTVWQGYGLTECSPVTHHSDSSTPPGSIGRCISNTESRIVDPETGGAIGSGELGELLVRGPQVMKGYLHDPDATAHTIDVDGWLHTGDVAYVDEQGNFYVVDRLKELIKYKGYQVAPAEIEGVLLGHPAVCDAAVIGSRDEDAGEVPKAYVVLTRDAEPDAVVRFVDERVAPHKRIRRIEVVDEIPRAPSGKILRRVLIERDRRQTCERHDHLVR